MSSLEKFGRVVSVDHFNQRRCVDVKVGGIEGAVWTIYLDGGASIANFDPLMTIPPRAIVGQELTRCIFSARRTRLQFGLEEVKLNPLKYAIMDAEYTNGELVYAQRSEANMPIPTPPYPKEREAPGPVEPKEETDGD